MLNMSHSEFQDWGYSLSFHQKSGRKIFSDRFFDATMLDITWIKTQSLRFYCKNTNFKLITHALNH